MARTPRLVVPACAHHVVAKRQDGRPLFASNEDKQEHLFRLAKIAAEVGVTVHGYCLMDTHLHLIVTPAREKSLGVLFHRLHTGWAMRVNKREAHEGHVFQSRYWSAPLDSEQYFWTALRYVEVNPRRAGVCEQLEAWCYSSAKAHLTGEPDPFVQLVLEVWRERFGPAGWREFLHRTDRERERELEAALRHNRPVGREEWIAQLEARYQRHLRPRPPGRPRKQAQPVSEGISSTAGAPC